MLYFLAGMSIGILMLALYIFNPWTTSGTLLIDRSDPKKDLYRFDIDDIDKLARKKKIIVKIVNNADLSQK